MKSPRDKTHLSSRPSYCVHGTHTFSEPSTVPNCGVELFHLESGRRQPVGGSIRDAEDLGPGRTFLPGSIQPYKTTPPPDCSREEDGCDCEHPYYSNPEFLAVAAIDLLCRRTYVAKFTNHPSKNADVGLVAYLRRKKRIHSELFACVVTEAHGSVAAVLTQVQRVLWNASYFCSKIWIDLGPIFLPQVIPNILKGFGGTPTSTSSEHSEVWRFRTKIWKV